MSNKLAKAGLTRFCRLYENCNTDPCCTPSSCSRDAGQHCPLVTHIFIPSDTARVLCPTQKHHTCTCCIIGRLTLRGSSLCRRAPRCSLPAMVQIHELTLGDSFEDLLVDVYSVAGVDPESKPNDPAYTAVVRDGTGFITFVYRASNKCQPSAIKKGKQYYVSGETTVACSDMFLHGTSKHGRTCNCSRHACRPAESIACAIDDIMRLCTCRLRCGALQSAA